MIIKFNFIKFNINLVKFNLNNLLYIILVNNNKFILFNE